MSSPSTEPGRAAIEVTMPETGSDDGAVLTSWLKGPGSPVQADEPICVVRVGGLTAEIVSPSTGVVGGIYADTGQRVLPGASLAEVLPLKTLPPRPEPEPEPPGALAEPIEFRDPLANLASEIEALDLSLPDLELEIGPEPEPEPEPEPDPHPEPELERSPEPPPPPPAIDLARFRSPAVRRLASQHGVDLADVRGTGRGGRITRTDVLAAAAEG